MVMQVILVLTFFFKFCLNNVLGFSFLLSKILDFKIFSQNLRNFSCPFNQGWTVLRDMHAYLKATTFNS